MQTAYYEPRIWQDSQHAIGISPQEASRKAGHYLARYITMMAMPGIPTLIQDTTPQWQFPIIFKIPRLGEIGMIGHISVNAHTGEIVQPAQKAVEKMQHLAHALALHTTPATTIE